MLPAAFVNRYTEKRNAAGDIVPKPGLSGRDMGMFFGVQTNASGENDEMKFYHTLDKFSAENQSCHSMLTLHGLQLAPAKYDAIADDFPILRSDIDAFKLKGNYEI